jgi:large subunit ribosomal protein L4e
MAEKSEKSKKTAKAAIEKNAKASKTETKTTTKTKAKTTKTKDTKTITKKAKSTKQQVVKKKTKTSGKTKAKKVVTNLKTQKKKQAVSKTPDKVQFIAGTKEVNLYSIKGKSLKRMKLPIAFDEVYRLDLIRRAVKAARANKRQPYGPAPRAGMSHPSSTWGKGRGAARVQRLVDGRRAVESPNNVGGRRAHPPTVDKVWKEKINKKERHKARNAALSAIADLEIVSNRGHKFESKISLPLILEKDFENIEKTKEILDIFKKIGVYDDVIRARNGRHIRAGKGKARGRKYRIPKSILIITSSENVLRKGVGNLQGVDVVNPSKLSVEDLAPGGDPGRLTIITEEALKLMGDW